MSENIEVISVVDKFLEHPRVYHFTNLDKPKIYISSADFMTRNIENRVEVATPIYDYNLQQQIINFACLTNFVALRGGAIKKEQMLSGDMADIFSNLYLGICVNYYQSKYKTNEKLTKYIIQNITNENQIKINKIIDNLAYEKYLLLHLKKNIIPITYENERQIFKEIMQDPVILENIKKNIHIFGILEDMENISKLQKSSKEYQELHDKIINVGEHDYKKLI